MQIKEATVVVLIINLGTQEDPWNMFCVCDSLKNRVVFFNELRLLTLPNYLSQKPTVITVTRDEKPFSVGTPELRGGHVDEYRLTGLDEIPYKKHNTERLKSVHFKDGDIITIEKYDWQEDDNPVDIIATRRTVGTPFKGFKFASNETLNKFGEFCKSNEVWTSTTIVMESNPGKDYKNYF